MDVKVVWSPEAVEDLESITEYIERDSVSYAQAVATNILTVSRSLGNFPLVGRLVPEVDDEDIRAGSSPWYWHSLRSLFPHASREGAP